jgi:group I intron endonuclease
MFCVYIIHNIINNKIYVGKTDNLKRRWAAHCSVANSKVLTNKQPISLAIAKYGIESFTISIIQNFMDETVCLDAEKYWIKFYNSLNNKFGYNLTEGGEGISGWRHTPESKKKMSQSHQGKLRSPQHKSAIKKARTGTKHLRETIYKISGDNSVNSKITFEIVRKIRNLYLTENYSHRKLSKIFNISKTQITNIINNKQWKE